MSMEGSFIDSGSEKLTGRSNTKLKFDKETAKRRQMIFELINKRKSVSRHGISTNKQN